MLKRSLKWLGLVAAGLVVVIVVAIAAVYLISNRHFARHFDVQVQAVPVPAGAAAIAEGQRLYTSRSCPDCHGPDLAGKAFVDDPLAGHFAGPNLTKGQGGLGGTLSDADFVRAIRHGVAPDGRALIFMPSTDFYAMSDPDLGAIIAYIRSVPPVDKPPPAPRIGVISRVLLLAGQMPYLVSAEVIDHKAPAPGTVKAEVSVEYGRYLANGCTGCHGFGFSGGPIPGGAPEWPPARNITPDPATGLGKWSEADFIKALRTGVDPKGEQVRFPMPWQNFSHLTDTEVKALWAYLKTVPPKPAGNR